MEESFNKDESIDLVDPEGSGEEDNHSNYAVSPTEAQNQSKNQIQNVLIHFDNHVLSVSRPYFSILN